MQRSRATRIAELIVRVEDALVALLLFGLIGISCAQILRRSLFQDGWIHADAIGRTLVLWIALLGALAAVRTAQHVAIDILDKAAPPTLRRVMGVLSCLLASAFCAGMAWLALGLLRMDLEAGVEWLPGIASAWAYAAIPLCFVLMAMRFLGAAVWPPAVGRSASAGQEHA